MINLLDGLTVSYFFNLIIKQKKNTKQKEAGEEQRPREKDRHISGDKPEPIRPRGRDKRASREREKHRLRYRN